MPGVNYDLSGALGDPSFERQLRAEAFARARRRLARMERDQAASEADRTADVVRRAE